MNAFTGFTVPSAFETCETAASFVRGVRRFSNSSTGTSPSSVIGTTTSLAPVFSQASCHGTMFEWCSRPVMRTSSPAFRKSRAKPAATRLIASVVPRVKTISFGEAAPRKRATFSRPPS